MQKFIRKLPKRFAICELRTANSNPVYVLIMSHTCLRVNPHSIVMLRVQVQLQFGYYHYSFKYIYSTILFYLIFQVWPFFHVTQLRKINMGKVYCFIFCCFGTCSTYPVFLSHVGIRQMLTWLMTWKAKSLHHINIFLPTWIFPQLQMFKIIKIKPEKNPYTQANTCLLHISRNFNDIFKYIYFTLYLFKL